ncbi:MAG: menaquinone biosynthesis protein [Leptospiraceae bacterium]|nr:menaquinone biosynthesis protein [Leptospiraceae bacterium]MDW7975882.1 menaquinone biosynthesis protein [Leptospiraceae bacterium]
MPKEKTPLRIGTVKFLNAKPLDYGFLHKEKWQNVSFLPLYDYQIIEDIPSTLVNMLLEKKIDIGLISSVEVLRNQDLLDYYPHLGVCAHKRVASILFLKQEFFFDRPVKRIYLDISSRSSVALLKVLYYKTFQELPEFIYEHPDRIIKQIQNSPDTAGLIIGDPAIQVFLNSYGFFVKDLAEWWYEFTQLPFVFALWSFSKELIFQKEIFQESYELGRQSLEQIIKQSPFPKEFSFEYLTKILHYQITKKEWESLQLFSKYLMELGLM